MTETLAMDVKRKFTEEETKYLVNMRCLTAFIGEIQIQICSKMINYHFTLMVLAKVLSPLSVSVGEDVKTGPPALPLVVSLGTSSGEQFGEPREDGGTPVAVFCVSYSTQ